jgi:ABC-type transport system involved in multi-copper enzyme maturation permease subunit
VIVYLLFAIFYLIKCNRNDPSVVGWAYTFATVLFLFGVVILGADYLLIRYIKSKSAFWIIQIMLFSLLVWLFIKEGLPGRL